MQLLAELSTLPSDLTVREWVAHSGLDPAHEISGSSVRKASRISRAGNRHLRRALYMPALVASRCDPHAKAFFKNLLARNKARLQALIAVARKLLHAIYGIFRSGLKYEGTKLFPRITLSRQNLFLIRSVSFASIARGLRPDCQSFESCHDSRHNSRNGLQTEPLWTGGGPVQGFRATASAMPSLVATTQAGPLQACHPHSTIPSHPFRYCWSVTCSIQSTTLPSSFS